jgi:hypothetical protein
MATSAALGNADASSLVSEIIRWKHSMQRRTVEILDNEVFL